MKQRILAILKHSSPWSYGMLGLLIFLSFIYLNRLSNIDWTSMAEGFWNWIDPVAGIMTFITTLAIFWFQASKNWEDSLEKMLTVEYIYTGGESELLIAKIENAYLAGESDVRQWAQSLGQQIMGNLDFDMNWDELPQKINYHQKEGKFFKYYEVKLYLTTDPRTIDNDERKGMKVMEAFMRRAFRHSRIEGNIDHLPIKWIRK